MVSQIEMTTVSEPSMMCRAVVPTFPFRFERTHRELMPREARIRAVRAEDGERILDAFRALDPQSVYQRFFHPKKALTDRELQSITRHNADRKLVLVKS